MNELDYKNKISDIYRSLKEQWSAIVDSTDNSNFNMSDPTSLLTPLKCDFIKFAFAYKQGKYEIAYKYLLSVVNYDQRHFQWPNDHYLCFCIIRTGDELGI